MFGFKRLDQTFELIRTSDFSPAETLAKMSNVTPRTVRSDISKINSVLEEHGARVAIKRDAGYYLQVTDQTLFDVFQAQIAHEHRDEPDLSSVDERIRFLLRTLIDAEGYISYESLAASVYVGENTLSNYIRQIKDLLAKYDLALLVKNGVGVKVLGREDDKRRCYVDNVIVRNMQDYVKGFSKEEARLFPEINLILLEQTVRHRLAQSEIFTSDYDFKNLLVHIALMIERARHGCVVETNNRMEMTPRIELFVDNTCNELESIFNIQINAAERSYFYLHLLANTSIKGPDFNDHLFRNDVDRLLEYAYEAYGFDLRDDVALKRNLLEHLNATFKSKELKIAKKNPLLNTIRKNYPLPFEIALASALKVFDTEPYVLSEDEVGYVALHMGAAIERLSPTKHDKLKTALVCGAGKSIEQMLLSRLETLFGDKLDVVEIYSYASFKAVSPQELNELQLVISTVPLESCNVPNVLVDFSLNSRDTGAVSRLVNAIESQQTNQIEKFFDSKLFTHVENPTSKAAVLEELCRMLEEYGAVGEGFLQSVLERETVSDTSMTDSFAIPHPMNVMGLKTRVAVAVLKDPVSWNPGIDGVQIVFLLAIQPGDRTNIEHLYDLLLEVTNNKAMRNDIISSNTFKAFISAIVPSVNNDL